MVKRLSAGLVSVVLVAAVLAVLDSPPAAAAGTIAVQGHNLPAANLFEFRDRCSSSTANPPAAQPLGLRSGSVGSHSIGWQFGAADYEVGALAPVHNPETVGTIEVDVYSPRGVTNGHAVGFYYDTTPGFTAGYWVGFRQVTHTASGWGTVSTGGLGLFWEYYENGTLLFFYQNPLTVAQLASARGGGGGAYVGVAFGCEADAFYVDNLRVADATDQSVYDFEGATSGSGLLWYSEKKKKNKKPVIKFHTSNLAVLYGTKFSLLGLGWEPSTGGVYGGAGTLFQQPLGSPSYSAAGRAGFNSKNFAVFNVNPQRRTTYYLATDETDWYEAAGSNAIRVYVLARLAGRIHDQTLKPGQKAVITGKIAPGDPGTKITLERRVGNGWAKAYTTKTIRGGSFNVSTKATRVGTMVLRLNVASPGKGVEGAVSTWIYVSVTPKPKPKPPPNPQNPGGGGSAETEQSTTASTGSTPPTPGDVRVLTRLVAQSPTAPLLPTSEPACTLPGPYLAPCAPRPLD